VRTELAPPLKDVWIKQVTPTIIKKEAEITFRTSIQGRTPNTTCLQIRDVESMDSKSAWVKTKS